MICFANASMSLAIESGFCSHELDVDLAEVEFWLRPTAMATKDGCHAASIFLQTAVDFESLMVPCSNGSRHWLIKLMLVLVVVCKKLAVIDIDFHDELSSLFFLNLSP